MKNNKNIVLTVVAHPDDEILGVGATLCKHRDAGDELAILILANGEDARDHGADAGKRMEQAAAVAKQLGAKLYAENLPDNAFDTVSLLSIAKLIENVIEKVQPNVIYTHHLHDLNVDHRLACQGVLTACRPQPNHPVKEILTFETLSSSEWQAKDHQQFKPTRYNNIEKQLAEKIKLMEIYRDELRVYPHPRSTEGMSILAQYRGMEVSMRAAEAFNIIRSIND